MISRVTLGFPFEESKENTLYRMKQLSELGFSELILPYPTINYIPNSFLSKYSLRVFGLFYPAFDLQHQAKCLEKHHDLEIKNIFISDSHEGLANFASESGLDLNIIRDEESFFCYNPIKKLENPLKITRYVEDEKTLQFAKDFNENGNKKIVIWPSAEDTIEAYLMHAKESLNRFFFMGIR